MKIASWNVNSIKARLDHVKKYLKDAQVDVLMIQELKGLEFPAAEFETLGYHCAAVPQKAYNGVAVIAKAPITVIKDRLDGDTADEQARYIEFEVSDVRLINIYAPNGNPVPGDKFEYKMAWLERLYTRLKELRDEQVPFAIGGDFNIIPEDKDCHDPKAWKNDALFQPEARAAYRRFKNLGLYDAFRIYNNMPENYTFWDYQAGAWQKNHGIRIDHFLLSPEVADAMTSCRIDTAPREWDKPSDHTPITIDVVT